MFVELPFELIVAAGGAFLLASTDMIATGVLDYSFNPDNPDSDTAANNGGTEDAATEVSKASS